MLGSDYVLHELDRVELESDADLNCESWWVPFELQARHLYSWIIYFNL